MGPSHVTAKPSHRVVAPRDGFFPTTTKKQFIVSLILVSFIKIMTRNNLKFINMAHYIKIYLNENRL